ncbi:uncharacterized protein LOC128799139 isoform X2 [Vidua chalybeata]|uniref:uncharacterized protein LOC128799139 isoform X2 n=1 Tax=Vidua chalybeata TaxID=81927 RepID=UPI0023A89DD7|nr:uncharacterized protein LOC128799139 isoform X2 [Vidua chalybeata]
MNPGTQLGSSGASIPFCAAFWLVLSPEPPKLSSWWETRHHPQKPAQGPPPAPARRGQGELPHLDWRFCPKRGRAQSPAPGDSRGWHCLGFKVPSIPKLWFGVDGRVPFSEPSPHLCWASTAPNSKEFQIPFPPAPSPGSCSLGAVICPLEGTSLRVVALPWLLRGWWHCRGCSGVGGTAVAAPGLVALPWLCVSIPGLEALLWLCVSIPGVGGTAVALCVHPWGWWHCCGSVCPSPGLVALPWLLRGRWPCRGCPLPVPSVTGAVPSRAAPFVQVTIVRPARQLPEWRLLFTLFYGAFKPHVFHHQAVLIVVLSPSMAILPQHSLLLGAFYLVKKRKKQKIFLPSETSTPPLSPFSLV